MPIAPEMIFLSDLLLPRDPVSARHASTKQYVDTGLANKAALSHTHSASDVLGLGTAATLDSGTAAGQVPVLDSGGKLVSSILPAIAITDTYIAENEAAMLALSAQKGDVCVRTDLNKSFILKADGASVKTNWQELLTPTDTVLSVNGRTGAVTVNELPTGTSGDNGAILVYESNNAQWQIREYTETITGTGSKTEFEIEHGLDTEGCSVEVFKVLDDRLIPCQIYFEHKDEDLVTLYFAVAPSTQDQYKVFVRR